MHVSRLITMLGLGVTERVARWLCAVGGIGGWLGDKRDWMAMEKRQWVEE
jgi:hypothetical protein